jgi:hypothetical protein
LLYSGYQKKLKALPDFRNISCALYDFTNLLKRKKKLKNKIFGKRAQSYLAGVVVRREEGGGRTPLGGKEDGGAVILWLIRFQHAGSLDFNSTSSYIHKNLAICVLSSDLHKI